MDIHNKLLKDYLNRYGDKFEVRTFYLTNTNDVHVKYYYAENFDDSSQYDLESTIDWLEILSFVYSKILKP